MEEDVHSQIIKLMSAKTGLRLDGHDGGTLRKVVAARMALHGLSSPEQYGDLLESGAGKGMQEREELISLLTVGESFFFRDKGQFNLLRNVILPELIELRKAERALSIWSAGCSTGEEPYSIAIILHETIPDIADWRLTVVGTDIKDEFLEKARKAVYRDWSFRMVPEEIRRKYFTEKKGWFTLDPAIKEMVTFRRGNLLDGDFPVPGERGGVDLILCRNVFIYYKRATAASIVKKMAEALRIGGYLMTGHWELFSPPTDLLMPRMFPSSLAYQRVLNDSAAISVSSSPAAALPANYHPPQAVAAPVLPFSPSPAYRANRENEPALPSPATGMKNDSDDFQSLCLAARAYADKGEHERAVQCLQKAIASNPLSAEPYYLLAHISEENGDAATAREYLKKVIYLEPASINGYLDLAAMYESEGDVEKARKMRVAAMDALRKLPQQSIVEPYGKTAAEFANILEKLLA